MSYNASSESCKVNALDYGHSFTVGRSDMKPIRTDLVAETSVAYQVNTHEQRYESVSKIPFAQSIYTL